MKVHHSSALVYEFVIDKYKILVSWESGISF